METSDINITKDKETCPITCTIIEEYLQQTEVREKSRKTYRKALSQYYKWAILTGNTELTRQNVLAYKQYLLENNKRATTVNAYLTAVKSLASYLESKGEPVHIGKIRNVSLPDGYLRDSLTIGQARQLINIERTDAASKRDRAMIRLMVSTALRTIEVSRANYGDYTQKSGRTVLFIQGKGKDTKSEFVIIQPEVQRIIDEYLETRGDIRDEEPLFTSISNHNHGGRMTTESISRIVKNSLRSIGISSRRVSAHSLRHTCISFAILNQVPLREVQLSLGHHSSQTTTERYVHDFDRLSGRATRAVEDVLMGDNEIASSDDTMLLSNDTEPTGGDCE